MSALHVIILMLAGCGSGMINAVAGGGNLLVLPAFLAVGLDPFTAAITGSLAVAPASYASAFGYRHDLRRLPRYYFLLLIPCFFGGLAGIALLHRTSNHLFAQLLPWLVLAAVGLFTFQPQLHRRLSQPATARFRHPMFMIVVGLTLACVYGGYFGAGVGFLLLVLLGFTKIPSIFQMTGLKSLITGSLALLTIASFAATGRLAWSYGLVTAIGSICGGYAGARLSHRISPYFVRVVIIAVGISVVALSFGRR